jgi:hypothetical protein
MRATQALVQGSFSEYLNAPADSKLIQILMCRDGEVLNPEDRFKRLCTFLYSENFRKIPYIDISCRLFSVLRRRVREGQFSNREKAKVKLSGLFYDIDAISIYGPYSDAIFIDRAMHQWLEGQLSDKYSFKTFSAENWGEFHGYLDEIERDCPEEVRSMLPIVYPGTN